MVKCKTKIKTEKKGRGEASTTSIQSDVDHIDYTCRSERKKGKKKTSETKSRSKQMVKTKSKNGKWRCETTTKKAGD